MKFQSSNDGKMIEVKVNKPLLEKFIAKIVYCMIIIITVMAVILFIISITTMLAMWEINKAIYITVFSMMWLAIVCALFKK